jgi:lysophospholipase L1-like esterase
MRRLLVRKILFRVITVLIAVIAALVVVEAVLWLVFPLPFGKSVRVTLEQDLPGLSPVITYERNEMGLRSISMRSRQKPPGTFRILCLGGSTTDQPTQSTPDTWPGILETLLNEGYSGQNLRFEVGAYGRGGDKILHRFIWAVKNVPELEPDLVILLEGINDLCFNGGPGYFYPGFRSQLHLYGRQGEQRDNRYVEEYLGQNMTSFSGLRRCSQIARHTLNLERNLSIRRAARAGRVKEWHSAAMPALRKEYREYPYREEPIRKNDPAREFGDSITAMTAALKADGIPGLVLSQPALWKPDMMPEETGLLWFWIETAEGRVRASTAWLSRELDRYNQLQKTAAEKNQAVFFDLAGHMPRTADMFFDDCHFTDKGSRFAAEQLLPVVTDMIDDIRSTGIRNPGS